MTRPPRPLLGLEWLKAHVGYQGDDCLTWPLSCDSYGYAQVAVGKAKVRKAYRVMCELAHGDAPTPEHEAAHSCGRGKFGCVSPRHLSWKTRSENQFDSIRHGTHYAMKGNPRRKITAEQASEIRGLQGHLTQVEIGLIYGISHRNVGKIHQSGLNTGIAAMRDIECRHGIPYRAPCSACGAEHRHLEQFRAERQCADKAAVAKARELGRNHTFIDTDGCEVTATPSGDTFYNAADWW